MESFGEIPSNPRVCFASVMRPTILPNTVYHLEWSTRWQQNNTGLLATKWAVVPFQMTGCVAETLLIQRCWRRNEVSSV